MKHYTAQQLDEELTKLRTPGLKMPKMYSFDQVKEIVWKVEREANKEYTYKEIYNELKKKTRKNYGKRCKNFLINCSTCQRYLMLDILDDDVWLFSKQK